MVRAGLLLCLVFCAACSHKPVAVPPAPKDNSYFDLAPGSRLRIVVPLPNIGYELSDYSAQARRKGEVRLQFISAERSKDGQPVPLPSAPPLPFSLPTKPAYIRLVFLIRVSESDHNMAIISAKTRPAVEALTARLKKNPNDCASTRSVTCVWVPQGVAVRPQ